MKASINKDGLLEIKAETELEAFALGEWVKINTKGFDNPEENVLNPHKIVFNWSLEPELKKEL